MNNNKQLVLAVLSVLLAAIGVLLAVGANDCESRADVLMTQRACLQLTNCKITSGELADGMADRAYIMKHCPKQAAEEAVMEFSQGLFQPKQEPRT